MFSTVPSRQRHAEDDRRRRRDQVEVVVALEPLLHDLHVQQAQEAAAEAEPERDRRLRLEVQRRVVELELLERVAQVRHLDAFVRIQAAVHHRHDRLVAGQRDGGRIVRQRDRVADVHVAQRLDVRDHVADVADRQRLGLAHLRLEHADLGAFVHALVRHRHEPRARLELAVDDADVRDDAAVRVELRVEHQRAQLVVRAARRRNAVHDRLEDLLDPDPFLRRRRDRVGAFDHQQLFDLALHPLDVGRRQIDLVDDRDDRQVLRQREVVVRERLRLDALRGVDHQQRALARRQRARHFGGEVDVARRVDEVQLVRLPVVRRVRQRHRVHLDRDAALALEVHRVEQLLFHLAPLHRLGDLEQPVGQRRLAVVDVRDDAEVPHVGGAARRDGRFALNQALSTTEQLECCGMTIALSTI